jgi:hypothetical protein
LVIEGAVVGASARPGKKKNGEDVVYYSIVLSAGGELITLNGDKSGYETGLKLLLKPGSYQVGLRPQTWQGQTSFYVTSVSPVPTK